MISRSKEKCDAKLEIIRQMYPSIQTKSHACDFSSITTMAEYRELVQEAGLDTIDIGIVCLNAGLNTSGLVDLIEDKNIQDIWSVNLLHVVYMLKALSN